PTRVRRGELTIHILLVPAGGAKARAVFDVLRLPCSISSCSLMKRGKRPANWVWRALWPAGESLNPATTWNAVEVVIFESPILCHMGSGSYLCGSETLPVAARTGRVAVSDS